MIGMMYWIDGLNRAPDWVQIGSALTFGLFGLLVVAAFVIDRLKAKAKKPLDSGLKT